MPGKPPAERICASPSCLQCWLLAHARTPRVFCKGFGILEYHEVKNSGSWSCRPRNMCRQCAGDNDPVVTGKHANQVCLIVVGGQFHDLRPLEQWLVARILAIVVLVCPV